MFFFFWTGWGVLVPVLVGLAFVITQLGLNSIFGSYTYESAEWPKFFATFFAAISIWFTGKHFNSKPGRTLIDKQIKQEFVVNPSNTFFFIKMEYWAPIILILGIIFSLQ